MAGGIGSDGNEGVVPATGRMKNGDAVGHPRFDAATRRSFEDDDDGFGETARCCRSAHSFDEGTGRPWSIPPPAVRTRPDHICRIDEEHAPLSPAR